MMNHQDTKTAAVNLPQSAHNDALPTGRSDCSLEARLCRVVDYLASSLGKEDALEANLGSINSGLMWTALWLDESIRQAASSGKQSLDRLPAIMPAIETLLRVTRQVDRFAQIEVRAAEARQPGESHNSRAKGCLEAPLINEVSQSEDLDI